MAASASTISGRLRWRDLYAEADLYKAAIRVYTKPVFRWRKALATSTDGKTLYDFAARGLANLAAIHCSLQREKFSFRPCVALRYNFNGKRRTLFIPPWEERIVDLLLYRLLNRRLHSWFSSSSFAYRDRGYSLDLCQTRIGASLRSDEPVYVVKRDIREFFASIDHGILLAKLAALVDADDYLFTLLQQRVSFAYEDKGVRQTAAMGVPFGTAIACLLANIYLCDLDRELTLLPGVQYFRYADDMLVLSARSEPARLAAQCIEDHLGSLRLHTKPSHQADLVLVSDPRPTDADFTPARDFRHLGLLFRAGGQVALSRDKLRKIRNLFRFSFRRKRRRWQAEQNPFRRAQSLIEVAADTLEKGVRNVAVVDYYLKHVKDEAQLRQLDRWLAEEVLSNTFGGHKKSHFRRIGFRQLRAMGLPSLLHRRRMILKGRIDSPFFIWQREKAARGLRGTVARLCRSAQDTTFSPVPEAAADTRP